MRPLDILVPYRKVTAVGLANHGMPIRRILLAVLRGCLPANSQWKNVAPHRSLNPKHQLSSFGLLLQITLADHLIKHGACAILIGHIDISTREV